jgi:hypothetical protein
MKALTKSSLGQFKNHTIQILYNTKSGNLAQLVTLNLYSELQQVWLRGKVKELENTQNQKITGSLPSPVNLLKNTTV